MLLLFAGPKPLFISPESVDGAIAVIGPALVYTGDPPDQTITPRSIDGASAPGVFRVYAVNQDGYRPW